MVQDDLAGGLGETHERLEVGDVHGRPAEVLANEDGHEQVAVAGADSGRLVKGLVALEQDGEQSRERAEEKEAAEGEPPDR